MADSSEQIESLRKIVSPLNEVEEFFADLSPQQVMDDKIRDLFSRIVEQKGPITIDGETFQSGTIKWEEFVYNPAPGVFKKMITIWHEP